MIFLWQVETCPTTGSSPTLLSTLASKSQILHSQPNSIRQPILTIVPKSRFKLELTGKGPMDTAGTTNTTNLFELPVNAGPYMYESYSTSSSGYCDDSMPWKYIVAITVGCVGAFLLGVLTTWLAMRLWQKKRTAGAGFEQVDERASSSKATGKEPMREA